MIKENFRLMISDLRLRFRKSETPKVQLPRSVRILRATGAVRVRVTGYDYVVSRFVYTTQLRRWHPLSWLLTFAAALFVAVGTFMGCYAKMKWRALNG